MSDRQAPTGEFMAPARVVYSVPVSLSQEFALDQAVNIAARVQSLVDSQRWSHFLRQPVKVDLTTQRTIHHEDAETIFG